MEQSVIEQVLGILTLEKVEFQVSDNKRSFLVHLGSAAVTIEFGSWGDGTVVSIRSTLLEQIDASGERRQRIFDELNELNRQRYFTKLYCDLERSFIIVEYDLLGSQLTGPGFLNGLSAVASAADELVDSLSLSLGTGVRAADALSATDPVSGEGAAGPVVSA